MRPLAPAIAAPPEPPAPILSAQVALLYERATASLPASLAAALVAATLLLIESPSPRLAVWVGVMATIVVGRYLLIRAYRAVAAAGAVDAAVWGRRFVYGAAANGLGWGLGGALLHPDGAPHVEAAFTAFVIAAGTAALPSLAPLRAAYPAFLLGMVVPFAGGLFVTGGTGHTLAGLGLLVYGVAMLAMGRSGTELLEKTLQLRFENDDLVRDLRAARIATEAVNDGLRREVERRVQAQELAEEASRVRSTALAALGRDIRTPMNGVLGMTDLLLASPLTADQRHLAETAHRSAETLVTVVHELLAVAQSDPVRARADDRPLAARTAEALRLAPPLPPSAMRFAGLVLVVEDNEVNQQVASAMLRRMGCEVDVVANGRDALSALERTRYDLVFMDCHLPGMDGFATATALRALEARQGRPRQPMVALTNETLAADTDKCLAAGMDDYLAKPFGLGDLRAVLERWLARRVA